MRSIIAIKHHYGYINVRRGRTLWLKACMQTWDVEVDEE